MVDNAHRKDIWLKIEVTGKSRPRGTSSGPLVVSQHGHGITGWEQMREKGHMVR